MFATGGECEYGEFVRKIIDLWFAAKFRASVDIKLFVQKLLLMRLESRTGSEK